MITFTVLLILLAIIVIIGAVILGVIGVGFALTFGDIIICALIIIGLCKLIFGRKNKKKE